MKVRRETIKVPTKTYRLNKTIFEKTEFNRTAEKHSTTLGGGKPVACTHKPQCPDPDATDRDAARILRDVPEDGYVIMCGGPNSIAIIRWYEEDDYSPRNAPRSRAEAIAMAAA